MGKEITRNANDIDYLFDIDYNRLLEVAKLQSQIDHLNQVNRELKSQIKQLKVKKEK